MTTYLVLPEVLILTDFGILCGRGLFWQHISPSTASADVMLTGNYQSLTASMILFSIANTLIKTVQVVRRLFKKICF